MGRLVSNIPGVCQKGGLLYFRAKIRMPDGKRRDVYHRLPAETDPRFAEELARLQGKGAERRTAAPGSIGALIAEYRPILAKRPMAEATRRDWRYYLGLIEEEHGHRLVTDLRKAHVYKIRDKMADTPGKANVYLSKFKALIEFACERDWIATNPAQGVPSLELGEHPPWPADVLRAALDVASPMMRLIIITHLCSGQRGSDTIRMRHNWHDGHIMELTQQKTKKHVAIPMHGLWLAEIAKHERKAVTILYDRSGKPFGSTGELQDRCRRLMHQLGQVDEKGETRYSLHGLRKNACCYLLELGLSDSDAGGILGMTPETVRHYGKQTRVLMIARRVASTVTKGKFAGVK